MTGFGQPIPEQRRRVASWYQDKEVKNKSKTCEENILKDSVLEISGFYNCDEWGASLFMY
jgi:hypothetical protein